MLIFDENNIPILIESVSAPSLIDNFWVLDLNMMDFTLTPLLVFEEIICRTVEVTIDGFSFNMPAKWNILIVDPSTMQLDVTEARKAAGTDFSAFVYGPDEPMVHPQHIAITNFYNQNLNVGPALNKHQMLCHPISPKTWVCISPSDPYNKYLKRLVAGNII